MRKNSLTLLCFSLVSGMLLCGKLSAQSRINTADSLAFVDAEWKIVPLDRHAEARTATLRIFDSQQSISVLEYKARKHPTEIVQLKDGKDATTSGIASALQAGMAVNGSYFNVKTRMPNTFIKLGKDILARTDESELFRVNGVFGLKDRKGRKPVIALCDTSEYLTVTAKWHAVIAAGPVLMKEGEIISYGEKGSFYQNRHPRSFIGYDGDGQLFMVVIDGRFKEAAGMSIDETAIIAKLLGLEAAINLDGGGSSSLWSEKTGVLSHPSDNRIFDHQGERAIPNCIIASPRR